MTVEVNSKGTNKNIKAHILSDEEMREIGFTDHAKDQWYFGRYLDDDTSFIVTIPKDGSDIEIMTLDEDFGQYYDFQYILERHPNFEYPLKIKDRAEHWMEYLIDKGVLSGWKRGEYI